MRVLTGSTGTVAAIMHWHEFGDLEGPGWAAKAIGDNLPLVLPTLTYLNPA
jgi:hypothetical protein